MKKGVSPLVATVLLVVFSVVLGLIVMKWGEEYVAEQAEFVQGRAEVVVGCDSALLQAIMIGGVRQLCVRDGFLDVVLENGPDVDVDDVQVSVFGSKGVVILRSVLEKPLPRASALMLSFALNPVGVVRQVKFIPKVRVDGELAICARAAALYENIPNCP